MMFTPSTLSDICIKKVAQNVHFSRVQELKSYFHINVFEKIYEECENFSHVSKYSYFVNMANISVLFDETQKWKEQTGARNLIKYSWMDDLKSDSVYQAHKNGEVMYKEFCCPLLSKICISNTAEQDKKYNVIVVGEWILRLSDFSIVPKSCAPLNVIGLSMKEDEGEKFFATGPFYPKVCILDTREWCYSDLKIFDGRNISNINSSYLQNIVSKLPSFIGILHLDIRKRISFDEKKSYKISGNVHSMIVFKNR